MERQYGRYSLLFIILILLVGYASADGTLTLNSPAGVTNGTTAIVTVTFTNDNIPPVNNLGFDITYDNTKIEYVTYNASVVAGVPSSNTVDVSDLGGGDLRIGWFSSAGGGKSNVTPGASILAQITFRGIQPGSTSALHFAGISFFDMDGNPSTITPTDGTFSVAAIPAPVASFSNTSGTIRTGGSVTFTDTSTGGVPAFWNWSFNGGTTWTNVTNGNPQAYTYTRAGTNTTILVVSNAGGSSSATKTIKIYDLPVASFTATPTTVGTGVPVSVDGSGSTGAGLTYDWNWGDGTAHGSGVSTTHSYSSIIGSPFTITLTVSDPIGPGTTATQPITVIAGPTAAFTPNVTAVLTNGYVRFTDGSSGSPEWWNWSFGDNAWFNSTSSSNPEHQYTANGTRYATLYVNNTVGASSATATISVCDEPFGSFTANKTTVSTGEPVLFSGTTTGFVSSWSWSFGTGASPATSTSQNQVVTYSTSGLKTVTLTRTNPANSSTTTGTDYITVTVPSNPIPRITSDKTTGAVPLAVTFSSATSDVKLPLTYLWVFGDGTTSAVANPPAHTFNTAGTYVVNLSITNASGTATSAGYSIIATSSTAPPVPTNSTITGTSFSVNLTGNVVNYTSSGNTVILTNVSGYSRIVVHMSGAVDTTGGNLSGTISSVEYFLGTSTGLVNGVTITIQPTLTESGWSTNPFLISFTVTDPATDTTYQNNLPPGSTGYTALAVINVSSLDTITGGVLNMSVPLSWYTTYSGSSTTASTPYAAIMWTHAGTTTALFPTWGPDDGVSKWFTITPPGFSTFGIVGAVSAPASGGGGGGGGGSSYGGGGGGSGGYSSYSSYTNTAKMQESDEGKTLTTNVISTGKEGSLTIPIGTIVRAKDGKPLSTISVVMTPEADVPAVPSGAVYTFAGYAVTGTPDGATFKPAVSLKFSLTADKWNALLAKANGNTAYLTVKYYDAASGGWANVPTTVDPVAHSVTGSVSHFSKFGLFIDTTAVSPVLIEPTPAVPAVPTTIAPTVAPVKTTVAPAEPVGVVPWTFIVGVLVIIVIIGGAAYYFMTNKKNL